MMVQVSNAFTKNNCTFICIHQRLAKKSERQERKKQALRAAQGEKLQAEAGLDFETYDQAEKFHNLEAEADRNVANRFGKNIYINITQTA